MRPFYLSLLAIPLLVTPAVAGGSGGGKGGGSGGALGRVSSGIGGASRGGSSSGSSSSNTPTDTIYRDSDRICYDREEHVIDCPYSLQYSDGSVVRIRRRARVEPPSKTAPVFNVYAGAQKVHDSDGSFSVELAVSEGRFRVAGGASRYFERLEDNNLLTMTTPSLLAGIRIDDLGATKVFLEGGVMHIRTHGDAMGDSSLTGPIGGVRVEHELSPDLSLIGSAQQMWFDNDIRANAGQVGLRYRYLQASLRVLDFNVGPPLYGPEVGVRF